MLGNPLILCSPAASCDLYRCLHSSRTSISVTTSYPGSYLWERPWLGLVTWHYKNSLDKGGGQSIKLHASTKNVTLQSQGVDQSHGVRIQSLLCTCVRVIWIIFHHFYDTWFEMLANFCVFLFAFELQIKTF
jgi:hypothetical protein